MAYFYIDNCEYGQPLSFDDRKVKGYFSLNGEREMKFDCSELRYYKKRNDGAVHFDLNVGIESARVYDGSLRINSLEYILRWIQDQHKTIEANSGKEKWLEPDFICRKGVIGKVLTSLHVPKMHWTICAMKFRGTIYLSLFNTNPTAWRENQTSFHKATSYWGQKFEQYMVSEYADARPNIDEPMDQNSQFCGIFQSRVGDHVLLYCAKIDAVCSDKTLSDPLPLDKLEFIDFKTCDIRKDAHRKRKFKQYITPTWWCKCAPVGIKNVVCGSRDCEGIVKKLKTYSLDDLKDISREHFNPIASMNLLDKFLTHIARTVVNDCHETVYRFEKISNVHIELTEELPSSEYNFMPEWYIEKKL